MSLAVGRLRATSIVKGFADAMMLLLVAMFVGGGGLGGLEIRESAESRIQNPGSMIGLF